jgi:hypothetical protein
MSSSSKDGCAMVDVDMLGLMSVDGQGESHEERGSTDSRRTPRAARAGWLGRSASALIVLLQAESKMG